MTKLLILATSGSEAPYRDRRLGCQQTWLQDLVSPHHFYFVLANPVGDQAVENQKEQTLHLPIPEKYEYLPLRTLIMIQWALTKSYWDFLFKCDDDTYVHLPRLFNYAKNELGYDYVGATPWDAADYEEIPTKRYASGGAGYLLSRRAAEIIAENLHTAIGAEDLLVGQTLAKHGIPLHQESRFIPFGDLHPGASPDVDNDLITSHYLNPVKMHLVHARFQPAYKV